MIYWDTSALVPLVVAEPGSALVRAWLRNDGHIVTWALTSVEIVSAIERRAREGRLPAGLARAARAAFAELAAGWDEVVDLLPVRARAASLLARHALRAADAVQLAAALVLAEGDPGTLTLACLDRSLAAAAGREGFSVLTWRDP